MHVSFSSESLLTQVYAAPPEGSDEDHAGAFHRSLFIFLSPDGSRLAEPGGVIALRCQLPRLNAYYSPNPAPEEQLLPPSLQMTAARAAAEADPWGVADAERDLKSACGPAGAPPLFPELEICVERERDAQVRPKGMISKAWLSWLSSVRSPRQIFSFIMKKCMLQDQSIPKILDIILKTHALIP